ncbi:MAG: hypothetical protein ACRDSL_17390 [Pseudonocardiaceae bacterium]
MSGHTEEMDLSGAHFHDKKDIEAAQPDGVQGEEVGGQQPGWPEPAGRSAIWCLLGAVPEPGEFPVEPVMPPGRILACQA